MIWVLLVLNHEPVGSDALIALFVAAENWRKLPGAVVDIIQHITGLDGKKQHDQSHLHTEYPIDKQPFVWVVGFTAQLGTPVYGQGRHKVGTLQVNPHDFFLQGDWNRHKSSPDSKGQLDPSISVMNTDVFPFNLRSVISAEGETRTVMLRCGFFGSLYKWIQYLSELPDAVKAKFYHQPDPTTGRALSDTFTIYPTAPPMELEAISGNPGKVDDRCETVMPGARSNIPVCQGMSVVFNVDALGVPQLPVLSGVVVKTSGPGGVITVRCVFRSRQLPPPGNEWTRIDSSSGFQSNLQFGISPGDVLCVMCCFPTVLWQDKEQTSDLHMVGHTDIVVDRDALDKETQNSPAKILQGLYGHGPLAGKVKMHLHRVAPVAGRAAFEIAARGLPGIYGSIHHTLGPYQDFVMRRFDAFVKSKEMMTNTSSADNTLHLRSLDGWLFLRLLDKYLKMASCTVSHEDGVFAITAPTWEDAQMLLSPGHATGRFDLRAYGHGVVEMFAPIVFKWEMYDTTRGRDDSRSPDGFVAITFSGYEERDRHDNPDGIKDSREHPHALNQMYKRPSACPGF